MWGSVFQLLRFVQNPFHNGGSGGIAPYSVPVHDPVFMFAEYVAELRGVDRASVAGELQQQIAKVGAHE